MTSMAGCRTSACQSSPTCVVPLAMASSRLVAPDCSGFQPTRARLACAAEGERSAMAARCTPGVRGTCARYMEPNLPAPIRPTRTGLPSAARCWSLEYRDMSGCFLDLVERFGGGGEGAGGHAVLPRQVHGI